MQDFGPKLDGEGRGVFTEPVTVYAAHYACCLSLVLFVTQFAYIAANLKPNDPEQWVSLAEQALERNEEKMALECYSKGEKEPSILHC